MTGLEKITGQIQEEANAQAAQILKDAQAQADEIVGAAQKECKALEDAAAEKKAATLATYEGRGQSAAEQERRTAMLRAKQDMIAEVIEAAYDKLHNEDAAAYFATLAKLCATYALGEAGEIYLSKEDLDRLPADFEGKVQEAAKAKGGSLTLVKTPKNIPDGFVLVYGGVEENCTLKAIFDAKKDELQDKVNAILFG